MTLFSWLARPRRTPIVRRRTLAFDVLECRYAPATFGTVAVAGLNPAIAFEAAPFQPQLDFATPRPASTSPQSAVLLPAAETVPIGFFHVLCRNGGAGIEVPKNADQPPMPRPIAPPAGPAAEQTPAQNTAPTPMTPGTLPAAPTPPRAVVPPSLPVDLPRVEQIVPTIEAESTPPGRADPVPSATSPAMLAIGSVFFVGLIPHNNSTKRREHLEKKTARV